MHKMVSRSVFQISIATLFITLLGSSSAFASHFRGGSISWQATELNGDGIKNDVVVTVKTAWRYDFISGVTLTSSPAITFSQTSNVIDYINGDASGAEYALQTTTFTASNLDPNTSYLVYYGSGARISNLQNNANGSWKIQTTIYMKDGNLAPKIDLPIIYEVPQLQSDGVTTLTDYSLTVGATDPNADKIRFRLANADELGNGGQVNPTGLAIDANTGTITWTNSGNMTTGLYSAGIVVEDLDSNLNVKSKSHVDFILDLQNKAAVAYTPSTNIPESRNIIVEKGSTFAFDIVGTAVDVSSLGDLQGSLTEPTEGNFIFDPGAIGVGLDPGTYPITFEIYDTTGTSSKSYLILNFIVPDPKAPSIANIEGDSTVYSTSANQLVDVNQDAVTADLDSAGNPVTHLNNGYIRFNVTFTDGQYETLDIQSDGDGAGQIRRTGYEVFYEGSKIGDIDSFEDGVGRALRVDFGTASLAAVQALVRNLTYTDTFLLRTAGQRNLSLFIQDSDGMNRNYSVYVDVQDHPDKPTNGGPAEVNNSLSLSNGDTVIISTESLTFVDPDDGAADITLTVSSVTHGQFELSTNTGVAVTSFSQAQVNSGQVQFVHDNSGIAPTYSVTASDGVNSVGPSAAAISFTGASSDAVSLFENRIGVMSVPADNVTGTPSYAISGTAADNGLFNVGAASGSLAFNSAPDFETPADANGDNVFEVEVTVTGATSGTDVRSITVTLLDVNEAPTISGTPSTTAMNEGDTYTTFTPSATDPESDTLTYGIVNKPAWASFNTSTGELSGTTGYTDAGTYSDITISVSDGTASDSLAPFTLTVSNVNRQPTISGSPDTSVTEGNAYSFTPTGADPDTDDTLTYSITNQPSWASFNTSTGALTGTPVTNDIGTYSNIQISISDGSGGSADLTAFTITVNPLNQAPTISGTPATSGAENSAYSFTPTGFDADGDTLTYSISNKPAWASFNTGTGALTGTPGYDDAGSYSNIVISVSDGLAGDSLAAFSITVSNTNRAPTISGTPGTSVAETNAYSFTPTGNDADGDSISYSISNTPSWASFNTSTGELSGTPGYDDAGSYSNIVISVSDGSASDTLAAFSITVSNTNRAPTISGTPTTSVAENSGYSFTPTGNDADGDTLAYSVSNLPAWANFSSSTGALTGTPGYDDAGTYSNIVVSVSDGSASDTLAAFNITVGNTNRAPQADGQSVSVVENVVQAITLSGSDPDADSLSYVVVGNPASGVLSGTGSNLTYTPNSDYVGSDSFTFKVNDGSVDSVTSTVSIDVQGDLDGDGTPDVTDTDDDGDGIPDTTEGNGDADGDGIPDDRDTDSDNDGIPDSTEGTGDSDGDGIPDYMDNSLDEDQDGIPDIIEGTGDDDGDGIPNFQDPDSDNDGVDDGEEAQVSGNDSDNDGIDDTFDVDVTGGNDANGDGVDDDITLVDTDSDGIPDIYDGDSDNDGIPDVVEGPSSDQDNDGTPDYLDLDSDNDGIGDGAEAGASGVDVDGDGIDDAFDADYTGGADLNNDGVDDNAAAPDSDNDGVPDFHDLDSDNDGIFDVDEAGLVDDNHDGLADDGVALENSPQDSDNDGTPDYLDLDSDNDGTNDINNTAAVVLDQDNDGRIDPTADNDGDGIDDSMDAQSDQPGSNGDGDGDGIPPSLDNDEDSDGIPDATEGTGDADGDGVLDYLDRDSDNDGLPDAFETDRPQPSGMDSDLDGIDDAYDVSNTGGIDANADGVDDNFEEKDSDNDGIPDYKDSDSDNDGVSDTVEQLTVALTGTDSDSDGIDDAVDVDATGGVDSNNDGIDDSKLRKFDMDNDGLPDYRDPDSDGDGVLDGDENGDFNKDGIVDRLQKDEGVATGTSGGGSAGFYLLLILSCMLLVRLRCRMSWQTSLLAVFVATLSMNTQARDGSCEWGEAHKQSHCWYINEGMGPSRLAPELGSTNWQVADNNDVGIWILSRLRIKEQYFGELSYVDLGSARLHNLNPAITQQPYVNYTVYGISGGYWFHKYRTDWNPFVKMGIHWLDTSTNSYVTQENRALLTFGAGLDKKITSHWSVRFNVDYYSGDAQTMGINIVRDLKPDVQQYAEQTPVTTTVPAPEVVEAEDESMETQVWAPAVETPDMDSDVVVNVLDSILVNDETVASSYEPGEN